MRSNRNDWAFASSASPRDSWKEEWRWQSTKPGVATVSRPSTLFLAGQRAATSADLPTATILPPSIAIAASRMTRRPGSIVISQAMLAMMRSTNCTGCFLLVTPRRVGKIALGACCVTRDLGHAVERRGWTARALRSLDRATKGEALVQAQGPLYFSPTYVS